MAWNNLGFLVSNVKKVDKSHKISKAGEEGSHNLCNDNLNKNWSVSHVRVYLSFDRDLDRPLPLE